MQLAKLHTAGKQFYVHPSALFYTDDGIELAADRAAEPPTHPHDKACLAPEQRKGGYGDARSSVFAVGAVFYELLTGESIGPGMRRPTEVVPDLPPTLEVILGKALIADPSQRPAELGALAAALFQLAPTDSEAPPPSATAARMALADDVSTDVKTSMLPPATSNSAVPGSIPRAPNMPRIQAVSGDGPYAVAIRTPTKDPRSANDPTSRLAEMKSRLESDPRPRYVVVKEGMDHGPFNAVELLQQIASGSFQGDHPLRDAFTNEERLIKEWDEFAPFAEQAKLNRDIKQEKKALDAVVTAEKKGTQYKALIGLAIIGVFLAGGAGWLARQKQNKERDLEIQGQSTTPNIDVSAGLSAGKKGPGPGGGGGVAPGGGNYPVLAGGMSCESAQARYVEEFKIGNNGPPDLTAGQYARVLNNGSYLNACNVPSNMEVNVCAAVQNGRAVGVTVNTNPSNGGISSCVAGQIRSMSFPAHPRLDVARTTFGAMK
ncbi:MAG TPA: hypothetical protein VE093_47020 [Polyangiaceae bacterium]|jgi:hypothetical protein|nr:hypothetical protein [Polyangiaceae bacterium]